MKHYRRLPDSNQYEEVTKREKNNQLPKPKEYVYKDIDRGGDSFQWIETVSEKNPHYENEYAAYLSTKVYSIPELDELKKNITDIIKQVKTNRTQAKNQLLEAIGKAEKPEDIQTELLKCYESTLQSGGMETLFRKTSFLATGIKQACEQHMHLSLKDKLNKNNKIQGSVNDKTAHDLLMGKNIAKTLEKTSKQTKTLDQEPKPPKHGR